VPPLSARIQPAWVDAHRTHAHLVAQMLLQLLINGYTLIVFVAVILSWFGLSPDNPIVRVTRALTEPVLEPIRKVMPDLGPIDLSPMVLLIGLQILSRVLFH
jgi:YggT family protein